MQLSRRYRPKNFSAVVGQPTIKETLRREVAAGVLGHAYLFSGPRGIGKTTLARIFAKALNCLHPQDGEPCNACEVCAEIDNGQALDIIEMDAASHTQVDNVRENIIEHVRFAPAHFKFKVYILDEAHMLSTSSWNALLKTLEEPPAYAIFILATTELHKVPATIISRCQRFDFKRIAEAELRQRLLQLAKSEQVEIAPEVVASIIRYAEGCMRDAETLLDQLLVLGEEHITAEVASLVIPLSRLPLAAELLQVCAERNLNPALKAVERLEEQGVPLITLFDDLIQAVRKLLLAADDQDFVQTLAVGDTGERLLAELTGKFSPAELNDMALLFMERRRDAKQGIDPRFALELAVAALALGLLPHSAPAGKSVSVSAPVSVPVPMPAHAPVAIQTPAKKPVERPVTNGALSAELVRGKWSALINAVSENNTSLAIMLKTCEVADVTAPTITLRFSFPFHKAKVLDDIKNRNLIQTIFQKVLGVEKVSLEAVMSEASPPPNLVNKIIGQFGGVEVSGEKN
jgi:DNA polymerase-3 subunit gamma/tau